MTNIENWPLWLQLLVGLPTLIGAFWTVIWTPKTRNGSYFTYGFLGYFALFYACFVSQSVPGYALVLLIALGAGLEPLFRRIRVDFKTAHYGKVGGVGLVR